MSQIARYSTDSNFGSFHTLYMCLASELPTISADQDDILLALPKPFNEVFTKVYFTDQTGEYTATQQTNEIGTFWEHTVIFSVPKDRLELSRAFKKFENRKVACLIVLHNENEMRLVGTAEYPLAQIAEIKTGREVTDLNARTVRLVGISLTEAPRFGGYVPDAGEQETLPNYDTANLLQRVIALEELTAAMLQTIAALEDALTNALAQINNTLNSLTTDVASLTASLNNLTASVQSIAVQVATLQTSIANHDFQIAQLWENVNYILQLINQVINQSQQVIDRRRIVTTDLVAGQWTTVIHDFSLADQDSFIAQIWQNNNAVYAPIKSVNNSSVQVYSNENTTVKIVFIAVAAITLGKISTQTVNLTAGQWTLLTHNFNLADQDAFAIRIAYQEETIFAPVRSLSPNALEIFSTATITVKVTLIGV